MNGVLNSLLRQDDTVNCVMNGNILAVNSPLPLFWANYVQFKKGLPLSLTLLRTAFVLTAVRLNAVGLGMWLWRSCLFYRKLQFWPSNLFLDQNFVRSRLIVVWQAENVMRLSKKELNNHLNLQIWSHLTIYTKMLVKFTKNVRDIKFKMIYIEFSFLTEDFL